MNDNIKSKSISVVMTAMLTLMLCSCGGSNPSPISPFSETAQSIRAESINAFSEYSNTVLSLLDKSSYTLVESSSKEFPSTKGWVRIIDNKEGLSPIKPDCVRILGSEGFLSISDINSLAHLDGHDIETKYNNRTIRYRYTKEDNISVLGNFLYKKDSDEQEKGEFELDIKTHGITLTCNKENKKHTCLEKNGKLIDYSARLGEEVEIGVVNYKTKTYTTNGKEQAIQDRKEQEIIIYTSKYNYTFEYIKTPGEKIITAIDDIKLDYYLLKDPRSNEVMPVTIADNSKDTTIIRLHGGPGAHPYYMESVLSGPPSEEDTFVKSSKDHIKAMYEHFNLVFWQQRGSFSATGESIKNMTLEQMAEDLHELIIQIRLHYDSSHKVVLSGHSFGGVLAYYYLSHYPNTHYVDGAVIEASPIDFVKKLDYAYSLQIKLLEERKDDDWTAVINRIKEIKGNRFVSIASFREKIKTKSNNEVMLDYIVIDNVIDGVGGINYDNPDNVINKLSEDKLSTNREGLKSLVDKMDDRGTLAVFYTIIPQALKNNFSEQLVNINVPILLQYGKTDFVASHIEAEDTCSKIPTCVLIKYDAGHQVFIDKPTELRKARIHFIQHSVP